VAWPGHYVSDLAFARDGRALAASVLGGARQEEEIWTVRLWDVVAGRPLPQALPVHRNTGCLAFHPDGRTLAVGTGGASNSPAAEAGQLELWDVKAGGRIVALGPHNGAVMGVGLLAGGRRVLSADDVGASVRLWDIGSGQEEAAFEWTPHYLARFALSPDGRWLATGDSGGHVRLWPVEALGGP
jgi:WD40 repeat protein